MLYLALESDNFGFDPGVRLKNLVCSGSRHDQLLLSFRYIIDTKKLTLKSFKNFGDYSKNTIRVSSYPNIGP